MVNNATDIANPPTPILTGISQMREVPSSARFVSVVSQDVEEESTVGALTSKDTLCILVDLITCDDGGHIVGPASAEGQVHQASAGVLGVGVMFKDLGDRFVVDGLRSGRRCR